MTRRPTQWIVQGKWTEHDNKAVKREGWKLAYHPSGTVGITTLLSDKRTFGEWTNSMAEAWVRKRADEGSVIHERALVALMTHIMRKANANSKN